MSEWDGLTERRKIPPDLSEIWTLLHEIKTKQEVQIQQEEELRPKLLELVNLLERSKGVITFIKWTAAIGAGGAAFLAWAKDHIKL